nr:immunoglobulin heavy chain junction region [Macaca mulatta]MOW24695.1 immunoglobulin heavy chain junction region [Macaca mulatta]
CTRGGGSGLGFDVW